MAKNNFIIEHYLENLKIGESTPFLVPIEVIKIKNKLKEPKVNIFKPYKDSEKIILYTNPEKIKNVSLFEIISPSSLKHSEIMGALMNVGVASSCFGDIIIDKDKYYFYSLSIIDSLLLSNLNKIGKYSVKIKKISLDVLSNYERSFEEIRILSSSLRLDKIVSLIIKTNREKACGYINNKEVYVNYEVITKQTYILKENDIFSIHRYGKYKFLGVTKKTKKDKLIINCIKYI